MRPTISIVAGLVWGAMASSRKSSSAIVKRATPQLIQNGDFSTGLSGWTVEPATIPKNGQLCVSVPPGTVNGYVQTTYTFELVKNDVYTLNFTAAASVAQNIGIQTPDLPLDPNLNTTAALSTTAYPFSFTFSPANQAPNASLAFNFNGTSTPGEICLTDISLKRIDRSGYVMDPGPLIKVNQLGYLPNGPKAATIVTPTNEEAEWQLYDSTGVVVSQGHTTPRGYDAASGQNVSTLDFSSYQQEGTGYYLAAPDASGASSVPFDISSTLYGPLRQDALIWFYHQRSGIAINGDLVTTEYSRAAGHIGIQPNQGDTVVPCQRVTDAITAYGEPWTCNYTLDVTQGWYDAGDQGKYVVNGGVSTWQLLAAYERTLHARDVIPGALGDGSLRIPERNNGIPDILDEALWELAFMAKMQVPAGSAPQLFNGSYIDMSGLVHHKMHDNQWTPLPTDPSQDDKRRELHRPSTAATLNLAATAAQASRLIALYNHTYSEQLIAVARTAYAAAKLHPTIYAPSTDWDLGGGAYNDYNTTDEFYWAAAELYITTGEEEFARDISNSLWHTSNISAVFTPGGFGSTQVQALARLDLATVPNNHPDREWIIQSVLEGADEYLQIQQGQAYGLPLNTYPWGSNSNNLNNVQILGTAYDITGNITYRNAALSGIDYILGRNALAHSYVRGYGPRSTQNVHSRLYAHELDSQVPQAPSGAMSGGANAAFTDPPADDVLPGCYPQFCYVDDVNSYSTNEIAINWNSALSWGASWAADQGSGSSTLTTMAFRKIT